LARIDEEGGGNSGFRRAIASVARFLGRERERGSGEEVREKRGGAVLRRFGLGEKRGGDGFSALGGSRRRRGGRLGVEDDSDGWGPVVSREKKEKGKRERRGERVGPVWLVLLGWFGGCVGPRAWPKCCWHLFFIFCFLFLFSNLCVV
jgi:hypothetical protein